MIRCASLAALCAFGLSTVAHASLALTQAGSTEVVAGLITLNSGAGSLQFSTAPNSTTPVLSGSNGLSLTANDQGTITSTMDGGGSLTQANGGITDLVNELIGTGGGSGSITTITPPTTGPIVTTQPLEPLPLDGVIPPGEVLYPPLLPPAYPQQASMTCSGAFSVTFGAQTTVNCQADLWFTNGFVTAGQMIQANALGNILLDNVSFSAPTIQFNAGGNFVSSGNPLWLGGQTTINAQGLGLNGPIMVSDTGSLTINAPAIPEPGTWALMGLGLVGLSLVARRHHG